MRAVFAILAMGALVAACGGKSDDKAAAASEAPAAEAAAAAGADASATASNGAQSSLDSTDQQTPDGMFYELAPLTGVEAGEQIGFVVNAAFKPRLLIADAEKTAIAQSDEAVKNDAGGWTINYVHTFETPGSYYVMMTSEEAGATGDYSVAMDRKE